MKKTKKALSFVLTAALLATSLLPTAAFAEDRSASAPRVLVDVADYKNRSMNLTQEGNYDWVFVNNINQSGQTQRKRVSSEDGTAVNAIQYELLKDTVLPAPGYCGSKNSISFSWSDGTPTISAVGQDGASNLCYGWYGAAWTDGDMPEGIEAGWKLSVPEADVIQTLTFVTGCAWSSMDILVYVNGKTDSPIYSEELKASGSDSATKKCTLTIEPNTSIEVHGKITWKSDAAGEVTLMGAALSKIEKDPEADYVALLREAVDISEAWLTEEIDADVRASLERELEIAAPRLEDEGLTDDEAYVTYEFLSLALAVAEATPSSGNYANTYAQGLTGFFGWEGDTNAPIAWADGTYMLRSNKNAIATFGVPNLPANSVRWSRAEGYLPCFVSRYSKNGLDHTVENFADEVILNGRRYEVAYSRMTTYNATDGVKLLPRVSSNLVPLNDAARNAKVAQSGETVVREYCIFADQFGGKYSFPSNEVLPEQGSFEEHYVHMKDHWDTRLADIVDIQSVPEEYAELADSYKAGYIDMLIAADGYEFHAGEGADSNDQISDREGLGMLAALVQLGHTEGFANYAQAILKKTASPDVSWQFSWPFALYLQKTGDCLTAADFFEDQGKNAGIKTNTHKIAQDRVVCDASVMVDGAPAKIMKQTDSLGSAGYWVADNFAALHGLTTYRYLCEQLLAETGEEKYAAERDWAEVEYNSLLKSVEAVLANTMAAGDLKAIPMSMGAPNGQGETGGNGSWVAHYLPGQWSWDGYLFGAEQDSPLLEMTDATYAGLLQQKGGVPYNLGGDSGFSSSYNAGYFSGALSGEAYRSYGVEAYQWMIENSMSAPFGWRENAAEPSADTILDGSCAPGGSGVCPHVPGQAACGQMLIDAFLAEKADGTIIAGRGLPVAFNAPGESVQISNYLSNSGQRIGFIMKSEEKIITFTLTGDKPENPVSLELLALKDNIAYVSGNCSFDSAKGTVVIPVGTTSVSIGLKAAADIITPVIEAIDAIGEVTTGSGDAIQGARKKYDALTGEQKALVTNYQKLVEAEKTYQALISHTTIGGSGSSGSPETKTETKTGINADGSKTTTTADGKGKVTETTEYTDGTKLVKVTEKDGTITKIVTSPDGEVVETVALPGESCTITARSADGKVAARVELPAELPAAKVFGDISADHWARKGVDTVSALGLFEGASVNTFSGNGNMTRGMIVTVLHRLSGNVEADKPELFADVSSGAWYGKAVAWAAENGIVSGVGDGRYAPEEKVSREMLTTILYRYAVLLGLDTGAKEGTLASFPDRADTSAWAEQSMAWAVEKGLVSGRDGALEPGGNATRAEAATILTRFIELMSK